MAGSARESGVERKGLCLWRRLNAHFGRGAHDGQFLSSMHTIDLCWMPCLLLVIYGRPLNECFPQYKGMSPYSQSHPLPRNDRARSLAPSLCWWNELVNGGFTHVLTLLGNLREKKLCPKKLHCSAPCTVFLVVQFMWRWCRHKQHRLRADNHMHMITDAYVYSAVQINVVKGCVCAVLVHATYDHV